MPTNGWISKNAFQDNALAADDLGRAAMEDGYFAATAAMRAKFANGFVDTAQINDGAVTLAKLTSAKILYTGVYGYGEYGRAVYG